jgi:FkbM family methyltransferase
MVMRRNVAPGARADRLRAGGKERQRNRIPEAFMEITFRKDTWDRQIFEAIIRGEYGSLDFAGKIVVDIGAHIGSFSIFAALRGARKVLAFEAGADNFEYLCRNCRTVPSVECHHAAVWRSDISDTVLGWKASTNAENTGGGSVLDGEIVAGVSISNASANSVGTISLDTIIAQVGHIDLLKIDAEGSEYPILLTSRQLHRVTEIVGEYHVLDETSHTRSRAQRDCWNVEYLIRHLSDCRFATTHQAGRKNGVFHAQRSIR